MHDSTNSQLGTHERAGATIRAAAACHYHDPMRGTAGTIVRRLRFLPPALLTAGNAAAGLAAMWLLTSCLADADRFVGQWIEEVFVLLAIAMVCDALDGPASRALCVSSELGKKGDAAADAISFGGVPALLIAVVAWESSAARWIGLLCIMGAVGYAGAAWVRLWMFQAKQTGEHREFVGLPTPAATLLVASCVVLLTRGPEPVQVWGSGAAATCAVVALVSGLLMLGPWKYPHLAGWLASRAWPRVAWLGIAAGLVAAVALLPALGIAASSCIYAVCGPMRWLLQRGVTSPLRGVEHGSA